VNKHPPLYFAHANGFPAECYQELFDYLSPHFEIDYTPMFGHGAYPVTDNWPYLVDELIAHLKKRGGAPVIGVGHSMGGLLILLAACREPGLFEQIILLDSPLFGFWRSNGLRLAKRFFLMRYLTPSNRVRQRRRCFHSRAAALDYFKSKPLFQHFTKKSLELYVQFGLQKEGAGYALRFDRQTESHIFATIPHNLFHKSLPEHLKRTLIYCTHSDVMQYDCSLVRTHYRFTVQAFTQGSHLFPFEYPKATADAICNIIKLM
jgi:hypothetical protein